MRRAYQDSYEDFGTGATIPAGESDRRPARRGGASRHKPMRSRISAVKATVREGQAPAVVVALEPGEKLTSEAGAMMFISGDVQMDVEMPGGLMGGLKRAALAGESLFLVNYVARGSGAVGICGPFPGSIRAHEL